MDWNAVSAVGQLIGAVGVILSLIYLALQVRLNTNALRLATSHSLSEASLHFSTTLAAEPHRAHVFTRGLAGEDLTDAERSQFTYMFHAWIRITENGHYQFINGTLDKELWDGWTETARSVFGAPGGRRMWATVKPRLRVSFCEFVEREVLPAATAERARNFIEPLAAVPR
jgi:hypothetical protein